MLLLQWDTPVHTDMTVKRHIVQRVHAVSALVWARVVKSDRLGKPRAAQSLVPIIVGPDGLMCRGWG